MRRFRGNFYPTTRKARPQLSCLEVFWEIGLASRLRFPPWIGSAHIRHRAFVAFRLARDAHGRAEIHERLVEVEDMLVRYERFGDRPEVLAHRVRLRIAAANEHAEEDARDVGVEDSRALPEREAPNRSGGVSANPLER